MNEYKLASSTWNSKEIDAIKRVIKSDKYSMGDEVHKYEKDFANFFGSQFCVMTSSGSTANLLMIAALFYTKDPTKRLKRGDEVIVPAVSWSTTYFPLQQYGLKVKFVDIDINSLNMDVNKIEDAISDKTRAIFAVNLLGNPNNFKKIRQIADAKDLIVLEDNCESMGATYNESYAGTFGLMGTFSSFYSHHIATMEGGCILTDDEEIYHILLSIRAHGWTRNLPENNHVTGKKSDNFFEEAFKFVLPGYNVRPIEMSGAIGIEQLKKLPNFIQQRRDNAEFFVSLFSEHDEILIQEEIGKSSWFGFSLILKEQSNINRSDLIEILHKNNIEYRPIVTGNFLKNKEVLEYFDYEVSGDVKNSELLDKNGLFVGNHHVDIKDKIQNLFNVINHKFI